MITFSEVRLDLVRQGARPFVDSDIKEVLRENQDLWLCPSGCKGHRVLRGFKNSHFYRVFLFCPRCNEYEEL